MPPKIKNVNETACYTKNNYNSWSDENDDNSNLSVYSTTTIFQNLRLQNLKNLEKDNLKSATVSSKVITKRNKNTLQTTIQPPLNGGKSFTQEVLKNHIVNSAISNLRFPITLNFTVSINSEFDVDVDGGNAQHESGEDVVNENGTNISGLSQYGDECEEQLHTENSNEEQQQTSTPQQQQVLKPEHQTHIMNDMENKPQKSLTIQEDVNCLGNDGKLVEMKDVSESDVEKTKSIDFEDPQTFPSSFLLPPTSSFDSQSKSKSPSSSSSSSSSLDSLFSSKSQEETIDATTITHQQEEENTRKPTLEDLWPPKPRWIPKETPHPIFREDEQFHILELPPDTSLRFPKNGDAVWEPSEILAYEEFKQQMIPIDQLNEMKIRNEKEMMEYEQRLLTLRIQELSHYLEILQEQKRIISKTEAPPVSSKLKPWFYKNRLNDHDVESLKEKNVEIYNILCDLNKNQDKLKYQLDEDKERLNLVMNILAKKILQIEEIDNIRHHQQMEEQI